MNTFEAIRTRKSVRSYRETPVEPDKIKAVVEAGNMAAGTPMAGKVYFNVITNADLLNDISQNTKAVMQKSGVDMLVKMSLNPNFNPLYNAPVAIVISTDKAEDANTVSLAGANAACAGENMLLAATDLGLGSCYLVSPTMAFNVPAVCEAAKLPENTQPMAIIAVGYTDDTAPHADYPEQPENITYVD